MISAVARFPLAAAAIATEDRALAIHITAETASTWYRSQQLGDLDHVIGDSITIAGLTIPARPGTQGSLELDVKGTGKFATYHQDTAIALTTPGADAKHPRSLTIYVKHQPDKSWTYRNATQLTLTIGNESLVLIDVNGDGIYNEPGVDGMTWAGHEWLFPLPKEDERWCTQTLDLTGLAFGPMGETPKLSGRPLATTNPATLPMLQGINLERILLGLTPRPEDVQLSSDLQLHCHYMTLNGELSHEEVAGKPGFTNAGKGAGGRSILGVGSSGGMALQMTGTLFHRLDVIRPDTLAFGVGYDGKYGGIDGRSHMAQMPTTCWPLLTPAPDQLQVRPNYLHESPDAAPGNSHAGYPIAVYFPSGNLALTNYSLIAIGSDQNRAAANTGSIECYTFDPKTSSMTAYERCIALVPKQTLANQTTYEVTIAATVSGAPWTRTWRFSTGTGSVRPGR